MNWKNNRTPLPNNIKLSASFHLHMWIQTGVTVWKWLNRVLTSVTLTFDLWPGLFAWASLLSLVINSENFMMIWWWEHSEKSVTDGQMDWTVHRAAWSQLKSCIPGMGRPINMERKECESIGSWKHCNSEFLPHPWPWSWILKVKFWKAVSQE